MTAKLVEINSPQHWIENTLARASEWLPQTDATRGVRSPHPWIIAALMVLGTFFYYVDQTPLVSISPFSTSFFLGVHDLLRTLFLIPVIYTALVFRVKGSLYVSLAFLVIVLPRALLFSPYADPLLRPLLFVIFATLTSILLATQLNRVEKEQRVHTKLNIAYNVLKEYDQRIKENQGQLAQAERLSSLGQMLASTAYEINNLLAAVLVYTRLLENKMQGKKLSRQDVLDYLSKMESELVSSTRLVQNLMDFAQQSPPILKKINLNDVVSLALDLAAHSVDIQKIEVIKELDSSLPELVADFDQIQQVCHNLILNAVEAMPQGGRLTVRTSAGDNSELKLEIQDTGSGVPEENVSRLVTPLFTARDGVSGASLGLAVACGIVQNHQGRIERQNKAGEGSTLTVYLPLRPGKKG